MKLTLATRSFGGALFAATLALTSAFVFGATLRWEAARSSQQQLTTELWFEPGTPTSPAMVAKGRRLFLDSCAHCHGADARGDEGPDLHDVQVSDRYIANIIAHGIPHEMPAFAKKHDASEIATVRAYVRSLQ